MNYTYVDTQEKLKEMCEELSQKKVIAIDIECENNLHHYGSYISIIQISTKEKNWVVDVLTLKEIQLLLDIFKDTNITKIFHDVSFDFRILNHQFKTIPKNVYDTQIAALLIGESAVGLGSLLEKFFSVKKESKFQMADWTKRPINPEMMAYAVKDTAYLIDLKDELDKKIKKLNRVEWLKEELEHLQTKEYEYRELLFDDMKGISKLNLKEKLFAKKIYDLRDTLAKKTDKPPHRMISNKKLMSLAQEPPQTREEWQSMKGMHPKIKAKAPFLYSETQKMPIKKEISQNKERKSYTEQQKQQLQELENTRVKIAKELNLEPYLIMSKEQIHDVVRTKKYDSLRDWQKKLILRETKLFNN